MGYEIYDPSRRDILKSMLIGAGGYAFASMLTSSEEALAQSIEGYLDKIPMNVRWEIASASYVRFQISYFKLIYDQKGKEKYIEFLKERAQTLPRVLKASVDRFGFSGNDAKSAAAILSALTNIGYGPQTRFEIEEGTSEKARVKCSNCLLWNSAQEMKITDDLCSPWSQFAWDARAKAINPNLNSTLVKARPRGDSICEWVIELKA